MRVEYLGGRKLVAHHRGHAVVTDQVVEQGGDDSAVTPAEMFIASMATCPMVYVLAFAERHSITVEGLTADVDYEIVDNPRRVGRMTIRIHLPAPVSEEHRAALQRAAEQCLVHNTLLHPPQVEMSVG